VVPPQGSIPAASLNGWTFAGLTSGGGTGTPEGYAHQVDGEVRVQGPTADPADDVLLEGKEVVSLEGVRCLETPATPQAIRVIAGARQLGRLKHDILAVAPTLLLPAAPDHAENWLDWWISSWEPTYREVRLDDFGSAEELAEIAFVSGWQLGMGKVPSIKSQELLSHTIIESRLRKETSVIVEELLAGWRELAGR